MNDKHFVGDHETVASCSPPARVDLVFWILLVALGVLAVLLHQRADFGGGDAGYGDAAQYLLDHHSYGVDGHTETTQPPGLVGTLAVLFLMFGRSHAVCLIAMAVFEALGFIVAYEILRRGAPRLVAATICILLLSSPLYFSWATRMVYPCFPYFFTTMLALLSAEEYEKAVTIRLRFIWGTVSTAAVVASLLIATGTIALLGAMAAVVASTALTDGRLARARLLKFLPVFLLGITVQGLWMHRKAAPEEWPLPGYPGPYLEQVKLKSGNQPELGMAKWSDIPTRVDENLLIELEILEQLILRHGISRRKVAIVVIPVLLIAIGWAYSIWKSRGTRLIEWYFAGYQLIYLLWPWTMELRFVLPIAPLACFYIWQGSQAVIWASRARSRLMGIIWFPVALLVAILGARSIHGHWAGGEADFSEELMVPLWLISAGCAAWMVCVGQRNFSSKVFSRAREWLKHPMALWRVSPLQLLRYTGYLCLTWVLLMDIASDIKVARENLNTTDQINAQRTGVIEIQPPEVEAGLWLRSHVPPDSVVMARYWQTVYHYVGGKSVWFPPISDPDVLLEGIVKHGVEYIVVVKHTNPYYLPDDDYCFDRLFAAHEKNFRLVMQKDSVRIFKTE